MRSKKNKRIIARVAALALAMSMTVPVVATSGMDASAAAVPKLSVTKKTINNGKSFVLKIDKNGTKIVKTVWSVNDAGDDYVYLKAQKKLKVRVWGDDDDAGSAVVRGKVTYKVGSTTRTKVLKCKVTVKKSATPTTAPADPSAAPDTPVSQTVIPTFDYTTNNFTLKFDNAMTCATAADVNNADGSKDWISNSSKVASVNWQGTANYLLRVLKVSLSSDGKTVTVNVAPNKMRIGARFDVVLTGFYQQGKTASTTPVRYAMNTAVPNLQLAVDDDLNQPYVDNNGNSSISVTFNQPVKNIVNYDSVVSGATYERGSWKGSGNAYKVANVYQVAANGTVTNSKLAIADVKAFNKSGSTDGSIEYITIDLGTVLTGTTTYQVVLDGFTLASGGSATQLKTIATFKNEVMIKGQGSYTELSSTQVRNGQSTDVLLNFKVMNNQGRGQTLTRTTSSGAATTGASAPSTYLTVLDSMNRIVPISYITSTKNSNDIEVGLYGGRGNTKYTLKFANTFPSVFLDLSSSQLMSPGGDLVIGSVAPTATPTPGSVDSASWNNNLAAFEMTLPQAFDTNYGYDDNSGGTRKWWTNASNLVTFYAADKTGYFNRNNPLYIYPASITLDNSTSRYLKIYMDSADLVNGQRYAMVLNNWKYKSSGNQVSGVYYIATVRKSSSSGLSIYNGGMMSYVDSAAGGGYHTHIIVTFNTAYANTVSTNEQATGNFSAGWIGSAAASVCEVRSSLKGAVGVLAVRKPVGDDSAVDIELNALISSGTFTIKMKNFYRNGDSPSSRKDLSTSYAPSVLTLYARRPYYADAGGAFVLNLPLSPEVLDLSDSDMLARCKQYMKVYGVNQGTITAASSMGDGTLQLVVEGTGGAGQATGGFRIVCSPELPYAICDLAYQLCNVGEILVTDDANG